MFKFLLLGVILSQNVCKISAAPPSGSIDTPAPNLSSVISPPNSNATEIRTLLPGNYNFHATHQTFYLNAPQGWTNAGALSSDNIGEEIRSDYTVTKGIGAHKVHHRRLSWNRARRICVDEGGHLAVVRSDVEAKIISRMLHDQSIDLAWVGFHDKFEEGDWITVIDEPIGEIGWAPWSTKYHNNPDNTAGNEHCGCFVTDHAGLNDETCEKDFPFVCKISIS